MRAVKHLPTWLLVTAAILAISTGAGSAWSGRLIALSSRLYLPFLFQAPYKVSGLVLDEQGAVGEARVRLQGSENTTLTDAEGHFSLLVSMPGASETLSAWKDGYYCAKAEVSLPLSGEVVLTLRRYQLDDNPSYEWVPPVGENSCYSCKPGVTQVWLDNDAHSRSASNPRFLSMYNGTDIFGNRSPLTRFVCSRDYGCIPLPPDLSQPYYGPGYKLDRPGTDGSCAACHNPGAAVNDPYGTDPNLVSGADLFGVHCDFCHKVADVKLSAATGLPYPDTHGVLSMDIRRPFPDSDRYQLFFGTFDDDNVPEEDTYLPLLEESRYCAPCHSAQFWGVTIYNSYGEWLESEYADAASPRARTCQECHMPAPTLVGETLLTNVAPGMGGIERAPEKIHAHTFPGSSNIELLQNAVTLHASAWSENEPGEIGKLLQVEVTLTNDLTGHDVPTDSPLRHLILLVKAQDGAGLPLVLVDGPTLPDWTGIGEPAQGNYAGTPGKVYAKVLKELWTQITPTGAYWNQVALVSDNRLKPFVPDTSRYTFLIPPGDEAIVNILLVYRRAFIQLEEWKSWESGDIVMESASIQVEH